MAKTPPSPWTNSVFPPADIICRATDDMRTLRAWACVSKAFAAAAARYIAECDAVAARGFIHPLSVIGRRMRQYEKQGLLHKDHFVRAD